MKQNRPYLFLALVFYAMGVAFYQAKAQSGPPQQAVGGTVTDDLGPITGVNVILLGQNNGTFTDGEGKYRIMASPADTLVFTYLGYKTVTMAVENRTQINVKLQEEATALQEVEVNAGYYTVKERERTGSIGRVTAVEIEKQPVSNPLAAMQGHLTGVNIVQATGVPGGGYTIEIRGKNFINGGTDPLFIVDGVPFSSQSLGAADISVDINRGNISPLNAINPADIENIEVLKDADATAIYGSRGANGVVLITTKKGKVGKTRVMANISSTLGEVAHFIDLMDTEQYLETRREAILNDEFGSYLENPAFDFVWPDLKTWNQNRYTDWQKELIGGTAYRNNMQLSVSGGSAQTQFLISGAHLKETTVFPGDFNYKKTTVHSTINHRSKDERFTIDLSTIYTLENNSLPRTDLTNKAYSIEPNAPALHDAGGQINWENNTFDNPLASL